MCFFVLATSEGPFFGTRPFLRLFEQLKLSATGLDDKRLGKVMVLVMVLAIQFQESNENVISIQIL